MGRPNVSTANTLSSLRLFTLSPQLSENTLIEQKFYTLFIEFLAIIKYILLHSRFAVSTMIMAVTLLFYCIECLIFNENQNKTTKIIAGSDNLESHSLFFYLYVWS